METAVALLFLLGCLGAADILLFHSMAHGIRRHEDSRLELWIHSLRGPIYATLFLLLPNFTISGGWVAALFILLVVDVVVTVVDFAVEGASREKLGGLPPGEYVLHMLLGMTFGAFAAVTVGDALPRLSEPTAIVYAPCVGPIPQIILAVMAALVFYSGVLDARAAWRMRTSRFEARTSEERTLSPQAL
jgi:hypothetical protein